MQRNHGQGLYIHFQCGSQILHFHYFWKRGGITDSGKRKLIAFHVSLFHLLQLRCLFLESVCNNPELIQSNIEDCKVGINTLIQVNIYKLGESIVWKSKEASMLSGSQS